MSQQQELDFELAAVVLAPRMPVLWGGVWKVPKKGKKNFDRNPGSS
jgi:hypothetical protein